METNIYQIQSAPFRQVMPLNQVIDPDKHMARLNHLGRVAEDNKMIGVSLRAEELRGKVAGYYVERILQKNEEESEAQLDEKLKKIASDWDLISDNKKGKNGKTNR